MKLDPKNLPQLRKELWTWAESGFPVVTGTTRNHRLSICKVCEHFNKPNPGRCEKCGCYMTAKTWMATTQCPIGKWPVAYTRYWFFSDPKNVVGLLDEFITWMDTPYSAVTTEKGKGATSLGLARALYLATGALTGDQWPNGEKDLSKVDKMEQIDVGLFQPAQIGDLLTLSDGRFWIFGGYGVVWSVTQEEGVCALATVADPKQTKLINGMYRIIK